MSGPSSIPSARSMSGRSRTRPAGAMRPILSALLIVAGGWIPLLAGSPDLDVDAVLAAVGRHCPGAETSRDADVIQVRRNTMTFTIHNSSKVVRWLPTTRREEGPLPGGFLLGLALRGGQPPPSPALKSDRGWSVSGGPYFETWSTTRPSAGGQGYWDIHLSVSDLDPECTNALFAALSRDGQTGAQESP